MREGRRNTSPRSGAEVQRRRRGLPAVTVGPEGVETVVGVHRMADVRVVERAVARDLPVPSATWRPDRRWSIRRLRRPGLYGCGPGSVGAMIRQAPSLLDVQRAHVVVVVRGRDGPDLPGGLPVHRAVVHVRGPSSGPDRKPLLVMNRITGRSELVEADVLDVDEQTFLLIVANESGVLRRGQGQRYRLTARGMPGLAEIRGFEVVQIRPPVQAFALRMVVESCAPALRSLTALIW